MLRFDRLSALTALMLASSAATAAFDNFTPLPGSVPAGALPETAPFQLSSPLFMQRTLDANTPASGRRGDNWDMVAGNETGPNAGRYLLSPYETGTAGVKRYDRQTGVSQTVVADGTQGFVSSDASRWAPWGGYLTAEESWGSGSTKGRLFELTNPTTTTGPATSDFVHRSVLPRVSHEGLAFDSNRNLYVVEDQPGGVADIWFAKDADGDGIAESMGRRASMATAGAEPTGLYFDKLDPNVAYVNIQRADSDVDRLIEITAVPEPESYALMLGGLGVVGFVARRRRPAPR